MPGKLLSIAVSLAPRLDGGLLGTRLATTSLNNSGDRKWLFYAKVKDEPVWFRDTAGS
jgi:hypothetical protein